MPLPEWKKAVPGRQSLARRLVASILNGDLVKPFGPVGASARVTHGLAKPSAPLGDEPKTDDWERNPLFHEGESAGTLAPAPPRRSRR